MDGEWKPVYRKTKHRKDIAELCDRNLETDRRRHELNKTVNKILNRDDTLFVQQNDNPTNKQMIQQQWADKDFCDGNVKTPPEEKTTKRKEEDNDDLTFAPVLPLCLAPSEFQENTK